MADNRAVSSTTENFSSAVHFSGDLSFDPVNPATLNCFCQLYKDWKKSSTERKKP
jgi:hypothetical protein